jgi:AcrR family transcriptional regulator
MSQPQKPSPSGNLGVRQKQKLETQRKLLSAARALGSQGRLPSISDVARHANVSIATAYRYYSDPNQLQSDAALDISLEGGQQDFIAVFEAAAKGVTDPLTRLLIAQRQMMDNTLKNEAAYRLFVAKGHEAIVRAGEKRNKQPAGGRRVLMIEAALKDIRTTMDKPAWQDMVHALMIVMGPEPFFILKDFANLSNQQILQVVEPTIAAVLDAHRTTRDAHRSSFDG